MYRHIIQMIVMTGVLFLLGVSNSVAAMWDKQCEVAIQQLQDLQQVASAKFQEMKAAEAQKIMANFSRNSAHTIRYDSMNEPRVEKEIEYVFKDINFALIEFSRACIKDHQKP